MKISKIWDDTIETMKLRLRRAKMQSCPQRDAKNIDVKPRYYIRGLCLEFYDLECFLALSSHQDFLRPGKQQEILDIGSRT
jgi:hypothetical protein